MDIKNTIRRIRRLESSLEIQKIILETEKKRYNVAHFRFQNGQVSNREVIEAGDSLTSAVNSYLDFLASHYVALLQLKKDMGTLDIDAFLKQGDSE